MLLKVCKISQKVHVCPREGFWMVVQFLHYRGVHALHLGQNFLKFLIRSVEKSLGALTFDRRSIDTLTRSDVEQIDKSTRRVGRELLQIAAGYEVLVSMLCHQAKPHVCNLARSGTPQMKRRTVRYWCRPTLSEEDTHESIQRALYMGGGRGEWKLALGASTTKHRFSTY